jgi:hypothetical protein
MLHTTISIIDYPPGKSQAEITRTGRDWCAKRGTYKQPCQYGSGTQYTGKIAADRVF